MFKIRCPAKLNTYLNVLKKREDGYHEISSNLQLINLFDEISFERSKETNLICNEKDLENRNLIIIDSIFLNNSSAKNLSEILQQVIGVDVRRRGNDDIQSDLYIRGGSFDQTLLLINGIKVEGRATAIVLINALPIPSLNKTSL